MEHNIENPLAIPRIATQAGLSIRRVRFVQVLDRLCQPGAVPEDPDPADHGLAQGVSNGKHRWTGIA